MARDTLKLQGNSPTSPFTEEDLTRVTEVSRSHRYGVPFDAARHEVMEN